MKLFGFIKYFLLFGFCFFLVIVPSQTLEAHDEQPLGNPLTGGCCEYHFEYNNQKLSRCAQMPSNATKASCEVIAQSHLQDNYKAGMPIFYFPDMYCNPKREKCISKEEADVVIMYRPQVTIPGSNWIAGKLRSISGDTFPQYIVWIYKFGVWLAISLSIFMVMVGGFLWMLAGGSPERVTNAKSYIAHALTGLVLALLSYTILNAVNPRLVQLEMPNIKSVIGMEMLCCCEEGATSCRFEIVELNKERVANCPQGTKYYPESYCQLGSGRQQCCCYSTEPLRHGAFWPISQERHKYFFCTPQDCSKRDDGCPKGLGQEIFKFEFTPVICQEVITGYQWEYRTEDVQRGVENELWRFEYEYRDVCPAIVEPRGF